MRVKAALIDLDGTIYFKGAMIPGADVALARLRELGIQLRFLTNTDSKSTRTIHRQLSHMGLDIAVEEIFTPVTALREFLRQKEHTRCYFLLSRELIAENSEYEAEGSVDYVVVGDCRECMGYETFNTAFRHAMNGAEIIALQKGRYFINADGCSIDTGAFVAMLEYAVGNTALVMGKPSSDFFAMALRHAGCHPGDAVIVGDDVTTDIAGAKAVGARSILVRTGKFAEDLLTVSTVKPDLVADSIVGVPRLVQG